MEEKRSLYLYSSQVTVTQYTNPFFAPPVKTGMLVSHQILYNHSCWHFGFLIHFLYSWKRGGLFCLFTFEIICWDLTAQCLICPNMWGTEIKLSSISREFYQKETINVPVNKQTYLLYSHGCHRPEIVNSRESVGNLDNLSVKMVLKKLRWPNRPKAHRWYLSFCWHRNHFQLTPKTH